MPPSTPASLRVPDPPTMPIADPAPLPVRRRHRRQYEEPPTVASAAPPRRRPSVALLWAIAPMAMMFAIGLQGISDRQMWNDEYATWYASTLPPRELVNLLGHIDMVLA